EGRTLRTGHKRVGLAEHLDADTDSVLDRMNELAEELKRASQPARSASERISHVIPRRHTETWLCALNGIAVDEERDCKRERLLSNPDDAVTPAAASLYALTRANAAPPPAHLPSLVAVVPELRSLVI